MLDKSMALAVIDCRSMLLETGIFMSQAIWLWRVRHVRTEAKKAGMTYDEYTAKNPSKKFPRSESSETIADVEICHEAHGPTRSTQAEVDEKYDAASEIENTAEKVLAPKKTLVDKWRSLVLRSSP